MKIFPFMEISIGNLIKANVWLFIQVFLKRMITNNEQIERLFPSRIGKFLWEWHPATNDIYVDSSTLILK